jgi:hypothetical protein
VVPVRFMQAFFLEVSAVLLAGLHPTSRLGRMQAAAAAPGE